MMPPRKDGSGQPGWPQRLGVLHPRAAGSALVTLFGLTLGTSLGLIMVTLLLSACAASVPWSPTAPSTLPDHWESSVPAGPGQRTPWWTNFSDPVLDRLVAQALDRNNDLAAATLRLQAARLQAGLTDTNRLPALGANAAGAVTRTVHPDSVARSAALSVLFGYEVDLWGRLALERDVARWQANASLADCQATALGLAGTVSSVYWELAYLNRLIVNSRAGIEYAHRTLAIVRSRHDAGAVSGGDVAQAEQVLASRQANQTQLEQRRTEDRHAMAILFDQPPGKLVPERDDLPAAAVPALEPGLPASILAHRPDLRAAEARLRAVFQGQELTRVSLYPVFSLTGLLGGSSDHLSSVLRSPVSSLGANLILPTLQGQSGDLAIRIAGSQYQEAAVNFRQRLYGALAEVEDRLAMRSQLLAEAGYLATALEQARIAEQHAETRYRAGATAAQLWLDTQQTLRNAEDAVAGNRYNQLVNQVRLYQALGGDAALAQLGCGQSRAGAV